MANELNQYITDSLTTINPVIADSNRKTVKNLLFYQQIEKTRLTEFLHDELNHGFRAFSDRKKHDINVYQGNAEDSLKVITFLKKSLDAFSERINNFEYICGKHRDLSEVDMLVLYLGLRDYCSNLYQQMGANYRDRKMKSSCQNISDLFDQVSDEIGMAYTGHNQPESGGD
jgi:hypothetical protein